MRKVEFYVIIVRLKIFVVVNVFLINTRFEIKDFYDIYVVFIGIVEVMGLILIKFEFFMFFF